MRKQTLALVCLAIGACAVPGAAAAKSPWLLRTTAIAVLTDAQSDGLDLDVPDMTDLAVDITYRFSDSFGVNVLATMLNPEVEAGGDSLGSVGLVPPIVTAQFTFNPAASTRFYAGAGFNYNLFHSETGGLDEVRAEVEDTIGLVAQLGMDMDLNDRLVLNFDLKYLSLEADVEVDGSKADELELDAFILGAGIGFWI